ncbi:MAG: hypothetical protein ABIS01_01990 [Ferruginibacter sp.]
MIRIFGNPPEWGHHGPAILEVGSKKINGTDYLLKPIDEYELKKALDKCRSIIERKSIFPIDMKQLMQQLPQHKTTFNAYKEKFIVNFRHQWLGINVMTSPVL